MRFSNKQAVRALKHQHDRERLILLSHGVMPEEIDELFEFDDEIRKSDRRFYRNQADKGLDEVSPASADDSEVSLDILDQIEDSRLLAAWMSLRPADRKIIVLHKFGGFSLKQIAACWGKPYEQIKKAYQRAIKKIKNYQ